MHKQPVYAENDVYTNGVEEDLFKVGFCLPAGPYVTDDDEIYCGLHQGGDSGITMCLVGKL